MANAGPQRSERAHYNPPWANTSIIGVAGSSGSGKTSLALELIKAMSLPWVVILSMDSFYKPLTPAQSRKAFANEYDFDSPDAIDFDILVEKLQDLKNGYVLHPARDIDHRWKRSSLLPERAFGAGNHVDKPSWQRDPASLHLLCENNDLCQIRAEVQFTVHVAALTNRCSRRAEIPVYSFAKHQRESNTTSIYSPHVLILEGIFALYDERVLQMLDLKIFAEADADVCLSRRIVRDVRDRGRDLEGIIKQWMSFVKPNFQKFVEPQRGNADIIVPRGIENRVAIDMMTQHIQSTLVQKSRCHREELARLGEQVEEEQLDSRVHVLEETSQIIGIHTILQDPETTQNDFRFYFDRIATLLVERASDFFKFNSEEVETPAGHKYNGLSPTGNVCAVVILRGGSCLEDGLRRVIPDCQTGRILIQSSHKTGEPELHYRKLPENIPDQDTVLLLDSQMSSGGAALMAVRVLIDHGVPEKNVVFVTYFAGTRGVNRLMSVFPDISVVVCRIVQDHETRWLEKRYFGC